MKPYKSIYDEGIIRSAPYIEISNILHSLFEEIDVGDLQELITEYSEHYENYGDQEVPINPSELRDDIISYMNEYHNILD